MSALSEQVSRYSEARSRLGYPLTPVKRIRLAPVPAREPEPTAVETPPRPKFAPPKGRLPTTRTHWMAIVQEVAIKHDIDVKSILGPARNHYIARARFECFYRMRNEIIVAGEPISLPQIGRRFGRDHTTVLHGLRRHAAILKSSENPSGAAISVNPKSAKRVGCEAQSMLIDSRSSEFREAV